MKMTRRQNGPGFFDLIEEATQRVRTAPAATLAVYYLGTIPFVLGLLFYWADMSRNPFAPGHLADASLGMVLLFFWMKFWQAIFAGRIRAHLAARPARMPGVRQSARILAAQIILQPAGLFLIPLSAIPLLTFPWVYSFFQNVTALADGQEGIAPVFKRSCRQAALWPRTNFIVLAIFAFFGLYVFLNWATICFWLPFLFKMLLGMDSAFTNSPSSLLNSTFFAGMFGLTYLCVDPILKTVYALRCFYGESLESGEDLKAGLKEFVMTGTKMAAVFLLFFSVLVSGVARGGEKNIFAAADSNSQNPFQSEPPHPPSSRSERDYGAAGVGSFAIKDASVMAKAQSHLQDFKLAAAPDEPWERGIYAASASPSQTTLKPPGGGAPVSGPVALPGARQKAASISSPDLDQAINQTIHQRKYTWRMPRETIQDDSDEGIIGRFFDKIEAMLRNWVRAVVHWLGWFLEALLKWLDKLLGNRHHEAVGPWTDWGFSARLLLWTLVAVVACVLAIFLYRVWLNRQKIRIAVAGESIPAPPDVADENVAADQLPEDGWLKLGRELLAQGQLRLAMRAFYLASLSQLAARNLISIARFKSNREYERELRRRGHSFPAMVAVFGENLTVFERIWYGMHDVNSDTVSQFAMNVERLKSPG